MPEIFNAEKKKTDKKKEKVSVREGVKKEEKGVSSSEVYEKLKSQSRSGTWNAFAIAPQNVRFETQEPEEDVILMLRQHPIVNVGWVLIAILLLLTPTMGGLLPFDILPVRFQVMTVIGWYLLVTAFIFHKFLDWYFNVYIVTDERMVDIDFYGLGYRDLTVAKLKNIEDINFTQAGGMAAMFNYGDVYVQTAGEKREFDFVRVPEPGKVVDIIYQLLQEEELEELEGRLR